MLFAWCQVEAKVREIMKVPWAESEAIFWINKDPKFGWQCPHQNVQQIPPTKRLHFVAVSSRWVGHLIFERGEPGFAVWFRCWAARSLVICTKGSRKTTTSTTTAPKKWARQAIQKDDSANHWCGEIHWSHPLLLLGNYGRSTCKIMPTNHKFHKFVIHL